VWFLVALLALFVPITFLERSFTAGANQSVWTPALGIVFGIMLLYGTRWAPVMVGTLLGITAVVSESEPMHWGVITALIAVIVAGYAIGAQAARLAGLRWSLRSVRDAVLLSLSGLGGTAVAIAGAIGVVEGFGYLHGKNFWTMFAQGCASAGASTLAITPLLLLAADQLRNGRAEVAADDESDERHGRSELMAPIRRAGWTIESLLLAGSFALFANLALGHSYSPGYYPMLVPLGWLALRRGISGTAVGAAVGSLALSLFAHSLGLKAGRIGQLEIFLLVFALSGLIFGSAQTERRDLENEALEGRRALLASEARLRLLVDRLREEANRDTLTRLPLKSLFVEYLVQAQARVRRTGKVVAVLYLDVDGFKCINDTYGHDVGDMAISLIADRLRMAVRDLDAAARAYEGGDEFLILCDGLSIREEAYHIARRIAEAISSPLELPGVGAVTLTASVGVAFAGPYDDPDTVVKKADAAMLEAKRARAESDILVLDS
jgi:diguanylate cyclase (GGDEF)-like protein